MAVTPRTPPTSQTSLLPDQGSMLKELAVLVRGGVLRPSARPDRDLRRLAALARFGPSLAGSFAAAAARDPDGGGVVDDDRALTYGQLEHRVRRIAAGLRTLGIGPGEGRGIAMLQRNSAYAVETLVAASRAGADTLLLNTFLAPDQVREVLERERPRAVVVDADLCDSVVDLPEGIVVIVGHPGGGSSALPDALPVAVASLDSLADLGAPDVGRPRSRARIVILTSGTTGAPKGARRGTPRGLSAAASILSRLAFRGGERMFIAPPVFHTWGLGMLQLAPSIGSTIVLRRKPDAEDVLAAVAQHRCTSVVLVPVIAQRLAEVPAEVRARHDLSSWRVAACSSAALSPTLSERFQDTFGDILFNVYGATEISWATIATPHDLRLSPGTAGRPPIGTTLALLGEDGRPVPRGEIGAIHVGNQMTFEGYTNGADKDRADGLLSTGDNGRIDEHGLLEVVGRSDDMVVSGGENVYPAPVEDLLCAHDEVREVVVVGVPDDDLGQRLAAYVVLQDGSTLDEDGIRDLVRARLARFSVPRDVVFLEELPRNTVGKVVPALLPGTGQA